MDTSQYLSMFLEESSDNLQLLNESLLILENDSEDMEILNQIFRVAHTIKGMAATMGYTKMAELTHKMEDVLSKFREGQLKVTHEVVTVLFNCLDILESMVGDITDGGDGDLEINNIVTQLVKIAEGNENIPKEENSSDAIQNKDKEVAQDIMGSEESVDLGLDEYDIDTLKEALKNNFNTFHVHVGLDEKTILKSARAFILFQTLEENGEILKSNPKLEDLESENFDFDIDLVFVTETSQDIIRNSINGISEIRQVEVRDISSLVKNGNSISDGKGANEIAATTLATSTKATNTVEIAKDKESSNKVVELKDSKNNLKAKTVETAPSNKEENKKQPVKHKNKGVGQSVRVDLERLDNFMNMVSELVIHRTRLEQISANHKIVELNETLEEVARTTTDLQDLVMKIRMLPLDVVFNRFPRMIRDLSMELNKEIDFEIQGQDTELDRTVIEEIGEPLIHLLRNAADHGVESAEKRISQGKPAAGKIKLIAYSEGTKAVIKVEDDGSGINVEKVKAKAEKVGINTEGMSDNDIKNLIFSQGFSTNEVVTDISGRGVGMDVVKTKISSLGGTVDVFSEEGKGTSFIIKLPLTLQIIQSLLVKIGTETMAISLGFIDRVMEYNPEEIKRTNNKEIVVYNDKVFKLVRINDKLDIESKDYGKKYVILAKVGENEVALVVDSLLGQKEIVIKTFGNILKSTKEYIGATILGDGLVTLILDVAALI
ncbi:chemotaxis protein CheA [Clostridium sulfidigenes]|uniref:Chemotaxis protein CheA n=1 Tax=Clostridium sulfidigenes TaxID=318464 RepID=A0A084JIK2_9CLOT|nr:chemotaxis protein CheA [Clostridium sulfidigenes]KEZ88786.1 chemotaxis protein CheA [Clostridium sulfidigenes]